MDRAAATYPTAKVLTTEAFITQQNGNIDTILKLMYALLGLAVLIALLGIANTLALSIHERKRELGLLRAVGMSRAQVRSSVRWESAIIVTQEVFVDLWRQRERFDPSRAPLRPWLAVLAHGRALETVRDSNTGQVRDQRSAISVDRVVDSDEIAHSVLNTEQVRPALGALPEGERAAIRLAYVAGKRYCQVAAELDVADELIKARIDSGLGRLASSLQVEVGGKQDAQPDHDAASRLLAPFALDGATRPKRRD